MNYIRVQNPYGADFDIQKEPSDFGLRYYAGAKRKDNVTLLQEMLSYEQEKDVRSFITENYLHSHTVCANAVLWKNPYPVFVERPEKFMRDKDTGLWKVEGGVHYTKKDSDFELPDFSGFYVPVPTGNGTSRLMLYHPLTGTPLETIPDREKAVKRLIPYLQQLWKLDEQKAKEAADYEVSYFWRKELLNGSATIVRRVHHRASAGGPRDMDCDWTPNGWEYGVGVRLFRWAEEECPAVNAKKKPVEAIAPPRKLKKSA